MNRRCYKCGFDFGVPEDGPLDPRSVTECKKNVGWMPSRGNLGTLCDVCFAEFNVWWDSLTPEQRAEIEADAREAEEKIS